MSPLREAEQLLERQLKEIDDQVAGLRELEAQRDRVARALSELRGGTGASARSARSSRPAAKGRGSGSRSRRRSPASSTRAPRGSNQQAIVEHVGANPGVTAGGIADATSIDRSVIYSTVSRMIAAGRLRKDPQPNGQVAYYLTNEQ